MCASGSRSDRRHLAHRSMPSSTMRVTACRESTCPQQRTDENLRCVCASSSSDHAKAAQPHQLSFSAVFHEGTETAPLVRLVARSAKTPSALSELRRGNVRSLSLLSFRRLFACVCLPRPQLSSRPFTLRRRRFSNVAMRAKAGRAEEPPLTRP